MTLLPHLKIFTPKHWSNNWSVPWPELLLEYSLSLQTHDKQEDANFNLPYMLVPPLISIATRKGILTPSLQIENILFLFDKKWTVIQGLSLKNLIPHASKGMQLPLLSLKKFSWGPLWSFPWDLNGQNWLFERVETWPHDESYHKVNIYNWKCNSWSPSMRRNQ